MAEELSEEAVRSNCPHCDCNSFAYTNILEERANFRIICDVHPLVEGHLLIVPRTHVACIGVMDEDIYSELSEIYFECLQFIRDHYGAVSSFEHGVIGQTVFHCHVHVMPCQTEPEKIVPEGLDRLRPLKDMRELSAVYSVEGKYLFFSIDDRMWLVDSQLGLPRFFRERFAAVLGNPERGNWRQMRKTPHLMETARKEIARLEELWASRKSLSG